MRDLTAAWLLVLAVSLCCFSHRVGVAAEDSVDAAEQASETPPKAAAEIEALVEKQNVLADKYNAIIRQVKQDAALIKLDAAITEAKTTLARAEAANDKLSAARKQEQQVRVAVQEAVEQKLREHGEAGKLLLRSRDLAQQKTELLWQAALAQFQLDHSLSPTSRALAGDAELATAKAAIKTSAAEEKAKAQTDYDALRAAKLAELEEGMRLLAIAEDSQAAAEKIQQTIVALEQRLAPIRREIERAENLRVDQAREQVAAALNSDDIKELRQAVNDRITEYNTHVTKLITQSDEASELKAQYDAVKAKIKSLRQ